jgi:hypothetical protein
VNVIRPEALEDPHAYWATIREAFSTGEPFVIIEADVHENEDTIARFETCPDPWCFNSYEVPKGAHVYEPVDPHCQVGGCGRIVANHPEHLSDPECLSHHFLAVDLTCRTCGQLEHAPIVGVQIAELGGAALGCSRFRPDIIGDVFAHEMLSTPVFWANMEIHLTVALKAAGFWPHRHMPNVRHG